MILSKEKDNNTITLCEICNKRIDNENQIIYECCLCKCQIHKKCNLTKLIEANKIDINHEYARCSQCKNEILATQRKCPEKLDENIPHQI